MERYSRYKSSNHISLEEYLAKIVYQPSLKLRFQKYLVKIAKSCGWLIGVDPELIKSFLDETEQDTMVKEKTAKSFIERFRDNVQLEGKATLITFQSIEAMTAELVEIIHEMERKGVNRYTLFFTSISMWLGVIIPVTLRITIYTLFIAKNQENKENQDIS